MEIKTELDMLKADIGNSGHRKSGNSLFGEVRDFVFFEIFSF